MLPLGKWRPIIPSLGQCSCHRGRASRPPANVERVAVLKMSRHASSVRENGYVLTIRWNCVWVVAKVQRSRPTQLGSRPCTFLSSSGSWTGVAHPPLTFLQNHQLLKKGMAVAHGTELHCSIPVFFPIGDTHLYMVVGKEPRLQKDEGCALAE